MLQYGYDKGQEQPFYKERNNDLFRHPPHPPDSVLSNQRIPSSGQGTEAAMEQPNRNQTTHERIMDPRTYDLVRKDGNGGRTMTKNELEIYADLIRNVEYEEDGWGSVYLDNCSNCQTLSWAGTLSSLKKKGLYRLSEKAFGEVRMPGPDNPCGFMNERKER